MHVKSVRFGVKKRMKEALKKGDIETLRELLSEGDSNPFA